MHLEHFIDTYLGNEAPCTHTEVIFGVEEVGDKEALVKCVQGRNILHVQQVFPNRLVFPVDYDREVINSMINLYKTRRDWAPFETIPPNSYL